MPRLSLTTVALAAAMTLATPAAHAFYIVADTGAGIDDGIGHPDANTWSYTYTLTNTTTCLGNCLSTVGGVSIADYILSIREFAIPYFDDAGITAILAPSNWTYSISSTDVFNLGFGAKAIVWQAVTDNAGIALGATLGGFGYESSYEPGKGPYSFTLGNGTTSYGDPAIPLSPNAVAAGILPLSNVPEPEQYLLTLVSIAALATRLRKRSNPAT